VVVWTVFWKQGCKVLGMKLITHLHSIQKFKMLKYHYFPICLNVMHRNNVTFFTLPADFVISICKIKVSLCSTISCNDLISEIFSSICQVLSLV